MVQTVVSTTKQASRLSQKLGDRPKVIAVELSNSQGKRFSATDPEVLIIQAAWTHTIDRVARGKGTQTSPQLVIDGEPVWFGEIPAQGDHTSIANLTKDKSEASGFLLKPLLLPEDSGDVHLICSYHSTFNTELCEAIKRQLMGVHRFIRNGQEVAVNVTGVTLIAEGLGAFWLALSNDAIARKKTLVVECGYRTVEAWIVTGDGDIIGGDVLEDFGVYYLASEIAADDHIRAAILGSATTSRQINPTQIAIALKTGELAKVSKPQWEAISRKYIDRWYDRLLGRLTTDYASELTTVEQIVFSGGGSMLVRDKLIAAGIVVDSDAATASIRGAFWQYASTVKA